MIMKAKLRAKIVGFERNAKFEGVGNIDVVGLTKLSLVSTAGKVDTDRSNAKLATFSGDIFVKDIIAHEMKIGATITISITDEEPEDRLD